MGLAFSRAHETKNMERHEAVRCMLSVGKRYSIATTDMRALVRKLVVLSVKYVSKRGVWAQQFGEDYVDWSLVDTAPSRNVLGGCAEWLALLSFCRWGELAKQVPEATIQTGTPPLFVLRKHMRECSLDTGDSEAWSLACKVFLLMLVQGLPSQHTLEVLTCGVFKRDTRAGCMAFLAKQVCCGICTGRPMGV